MENNNLKNNNEKPDNNKNNKKLNIIILITVLVMFLMLISITAMQELANSKIQITYDEFVEFVNDGSVSEVTLSGSVADIKFGPEDGVTLTKKVGETEIEFRNQKEATVNLVGNENALLELLQGKDIRLEKVTPSALGSILSSILSIVLSILMAAIMRIWGADIIREFIGSATGEIIEIAHQYLLISTFFYIFLSQIFIYRNSLQGMGEVIFPLMASVAELLMRGFAAVYLAIKYGYIGMFYSGPIAWVSACLILSFGYFKSIKPIMLKIKEQSYTDKDN